MTKDEILRRLEYSPADNLPPHLQPKLTKRELKSIHAALLRSVIGELAAEIAKSREQLSQQLQQLQQVILKRGTD